MELPEHFQKNKSKYYIVFLVLTTIIILTNGINQGEFWYPDASRHAMDGVFVLDFIKDLPILHIYDYTIQYYTKYPALGIGYYPPFFALVEAGFYAIFGISVVSARLTVLFFALIAVIFWFKLSRVIFGDKIALCTSLLFITTPFIVRWSKEVMLEMPTLAMIILSVYFFYNFIELNKHLHGYYLVLATAAAIYTKQTAVFLIPLFFFYLIFSRKYRRLIDKDIILIALAIFLLVLPLAVFTSFYGKMNLEQSVGVMGSQSRLFSLKHWLIYPKSLSKILTRPVMIMSITYILLAAIRRNYQKSILSLSWILGFYLVFTYINIKELRYAYFWLPPFILIATLTINELPERIRKIPVGAILFIILCSYQFLLSYNLNTPFVYGYEEAARYIAGKQGRTVFFQGSGEGTGNFVFHVRKLDKDRKMVVLRGDKILASSAIFAHKLLVEHVKNKSETYELLEAYGPQYFVVEEKADYNINALKMLREVLNSENFTLVKKIKINTNLNSLKEESLLIYKFNKNVSLKRDYIHIRLPIIGREITVPLETLSDFYTPSLDIYQSMKSFP